MTATSGDIYVLTTLDYHNINYSMHNYSDEVEIWVRRPDWEIAVKLCLMIPIMILGFLGNAAIIVVVLRFKIMRTCTNLFIFNMAVADFMTLLFCPWITLIGDFYQNYQLGPLICRLDGFIQVTFLLASVFSLIVIAWDRLLGVVYPFSRRITKKMAIFIIIGIWICAMACASPLITFRTLKKRQWADYLEVWCSEELEKLRAYWFVMLVLLCYAPLTIVTIGYIIIILQMDKYEHKLFTRENPIKIKYRRKVIQMLFIYLVCFFWSWFLFQVTVFYRHFKIDFELPCWYRSVYFIAHFLAYANSAINPIIYGAKSESFMRAFRILCPCLQKKNRVAPSGSPRGLIPLDVKGRQQQQNAQEKNQPPQRTAASPQRNHKEETVETEKEVLADGGGDQNHHPEQGMSEEPDDQITRTKQTEETQIKLQTELNSYPVPDLLESSPKTESQTS